VLLTIEETVGATIILQYTVSYARIERLLGYLQPIVIGKSFSCAVACCTPRLIIGPLTSLPLAPEHSPSSELARHEYSSTLINRLPAPLRNRTHWLIESILKALLTVEYVRTLVFSSWLGLTYR
jgi:hypothetical protein